MNRQPFAKPPRWWSPKLNRWWVDWWRPWRKRLQHHKHRLLSVEVRGLEHVREALARGHGILLTPNHSSHADPFVVLPIGVFLPTHLVLRSVFRQSATPLPEGAEINVRGKPFANVQAESPGLEQVKARNRT